MLRASSWRQALQQFQDAEQHYGWQLRETELGPYLALDGIPYHRRGDSKEIAPLSLVGYHVCYNASYQVPVMYFRAVSPDGAPLAPSAVEALFPYWPSQPEQLESFITQQEHPLLLGPCWYALHPCNTAVALALALGLEADTATRVTEGDVAVGTDGAVVARAVMEPVGGPCATSNTRTAEAPPSAETSASGSSATVEIPAGVATSGRSGEHSSRSTAGRSLSGAPRQPSGAPRQALEEEGVPDLEELLRAPARRVDGAAADRAACDRDSGGGFAGNDGGDDVAGGGTLVGPAGVRWRGGDVPLCPDDAASLTRYMRVWFSLVGPHVGLLEGRVRGT